MDSRGQCHFHVSYSLTKLGFLNCQLKMAAKKKGVFNDGVPQLRGYLGQGTPSSTLPDLARTYKIILEDFRNLVRVVLYKQVFAL